MISIWGYLDVPGDQANLSPHIDSFEVLAKVLEANLSPNRADVAFTTLNHNLGYNNMNLIDDNGGDDLLGLLHVKVSGGDDQLISSLPTIARLCKVQLHFTWELEVLSSDIFCPSPNTHSDTNWSSF